MWYLKRWKLINNKKSPIQDEYIEKYLAEKELDLTATLDAKEAYSDTDLWSLLRPQITIVRRISLTHPQLRLLSTGN